MLRALLLVAAICGAGATPAQADDFFAKLPFVARRFGEVEKPARMELIPNVAFSEHTTSNRPSNDAFKPPNSTTTARAGTDPFTGRDIPSR